MTPCEECAPVIDNLTFIISKLTGRPQETILLENGIEMDVSGVTHIGSIPWPEGVA